MRPTLLKLIRKKLELTQESAAELVEVSPKTWQLWESGEGNMHTAFFTLLLERTEGLIDLNELKKTIKEYQSKVIFTEYTQKQISKNSEELALLTHKREVELAEGADFKFIDLFAGIGGVRKSFEAYGGKCVFSSEIDQFAKYTYYSNFGVVPFGDIEEIDEKDIPDHDILCAGFPCQPFSHIGKREGFRHPTQGTMFHEIVKILEYKKSPVIFLENVQGLINHDDGNTLAVIIKTLNGLGYNVKHTLLNSSDFGVPQSRKRFYLVGFLDKSINFDFPDPPMIYKDIGEIVEKEENIKGYSISKHLQESYLFKVDDGKPALIDKNTKGQMKTLVSTYHKIQRLTGTFVKDGETGIRLLTAEECKAAMGFPKDFVIPVSRTQMYRQMGNSVAIPVVKKIAEQIAISLQSKVD